MIIAQHRMNALGQRLRRRAEAIAQQRARQITRNERAADWRDPRALWPDFAQD